jgi:hypothetical protein
MATPLDVKIYFRLDPADDQGMESESLSAEPVAPGEFRVKNSPFFVFGISAGDVVCAEPAGDHLEFRSVITPGGHSTYRVYLSGSFIVTDADVQEFWQPIAALGATYESANGSFFAVDIPPGSDIEEIYRLLEAGEEAAIWEFEEASYEPTGDANPDESL